MANEQPIDARQAEIQSIKAELGQINQQKQQALNGFISSQPSMKPHQVKALQAMYGVGEGGLEQKQAEADIQVGKEVESQEQKFAAEAARNIRNLRGRSDVVMGGFIDYIDRANQIHGQKPGPITGALGSMGLDALKINEFAEAFDGMNPEYSAAVAKAAIPGVRALRMVDVFSKGKPSKWSTVDSGIRNAGATQKMQLSGFYAAHPEAVTDDKGNPVEWSVNSEEWNKWVKHWSDKFEKEYNDGWFMTVYQKNPDLLESKDRKRIENNINEELKKRQQEL